MSSEAWQDLVDANEAHALTLTLAQRNVIAETAAYLETMEEGNAGLRKEVEKLACNWLTVAEGQNDERAWVYRTCARRALQVVRPEICDKPTYLLTAWAYGWLAQETT